jgi:hypothetical protein
VTTQRTIDKIDLDFLRSVENIRPEGKEHPKGDIFDGLVVGMDLLMRHTGNKKYYNICIFYLDIREEYF